MLGNATVKQKAAIDDLRSKAERSFYEQIDEASNVRRTSMICCVSEEDHLLGRGANPRTGLVTPGIYNASNIGDDPNDPRVDTIERPSKWRQRGNQWISLDPDQPTPVESPSGPIASPDTNRKLQKQDSRLSQLPFPLNPNHPAKNHSLVHWVDEVSSPPRLPSSHPREEYTIRRKPVGAASANITPFKGRPRETVPQLPFAVQPNVQHDSQSSCSSSAPLPQMQQPFSHDDVNQQHRPAIGHEQSRQRQLQPDRDSFLDESKIHACAHTSNTLGTSGLILRDNHPLCLPMNNGPYPLNLPVTSNIPASEDPLASHIPGRNGPRVDETAPQRIVLRTRSHPTSTLQPERLQPHGNTPMHVPVGDKPPEPQLMNRLLAVRHPNTIPWRVPPQGPRSGSFTPTSTHPTICTDMPVVTTSLTRNVIENPATQMCDTIPLCHPFPRGNHRTSEETGTGPGACMSMNTNSPDSLLIVLPQQRRRALSISQANAMQEPEGTTPMDSQTPSSSTGMHSPPRDMVTVVKGDTSTQTRAGGKGLIPRPEDMMAPMTRPSDLQGLTRRCSRCNNGVITHQQPSPERTVVHEASSPNTTTDACSPLTLPGTFPHQHASIHLHERQAEVSRKVAVAQETDNSICEEQDRHIPCLRHSGSTPATLPEPDSELCCTTTERTRRNRLSFVKYAFRRSIDSERSRDHTPADPVEIIPQSSGPVAHSEGTGTSRPGAIEAVKTALDKSSKNCPSEDLTPVAKVRLSKTTRRSSTTKVWSSSNEPGETHGETHGDINVRKSRRAVTALVRKCPTPAGKSWRRDGSRACIKSNEMQIPRLGADSIVSFWEMMVVPFAAVRMWIHNHPRVLDLLWTILERVCEMVHFVGRTGARIWALAFVYSKTGKLRLRRRETVGSFAWDCARSTVYLVLLIGLSVFMMRIVTQILNVLYFGVAIANTVLWLVGKLLGQGLLW